MDPVTSTSPSDLLAAAWRQGRRVLLEHEVYSLLELSGLETPAHLFLPLGSEVTAEQLAELESPQLILKVVSPEITHKSDVGGIRSVKNDPVAVSGEIRAMFDDVERRQPDADLAGVLIVEHVEFASNIPGNEFLVSVRRDPSFGPVVTFGMGGLLTEWYGKLSDTRVLLPAEEFDREAALAAIDSVAAGRLAIRPSRIHARAPIDATALVDAIERLAHLAATTVAPGDIWFEEIEINPIAAVDGRLIALDAFAQLGEATADIRPPRPIEKIVHLLHPKSAAVFGVSTRMVNAGRIILRNLKQSEGLDYGRLYIVHAKAEAAIDGVHCYPSTAALPEPVDLAVLAVPAAAARDVIHEIIQTDKAKSIILIPGGFAEAGERDLAREIVDELRESRRLPGHGPVMVGGNCLGIVSKGEYNTFFLPAYKLPFHDAPGENLVAVSQSGAYLVSFTSNLDGIVFPRASISYGNEMDLTVADFLQFYLEHEPEAKAFTFYIEGFQPGEGERFARLVRRATRSGRPVVVFKVGKTALGARAAASHTASMTGDYEVAQAVLGSAGALVAHTLNMLEDYTKIFAMLVDQPVTGRRVGVITNAGFEAGAVSDRLYNLELSSFSATTKAALENALPSIAHCGNPVDTTPMANTENFIDCLEAVAADPGVDMIIVSAIPAAPTLDVLAPDLAGAHTENIFALGSLPAEIIRVNNTIKKPMVAAIDSGRLYDPTVMLLQRAGIPCYRKIDRASRALSAFATFHLDNRSRGEDTPRSQDADSNRGDGGSC